MVFNCIYRRRALLRPINMKEHVRPFEEVGICQPVSFRLVDMPNS